MAEKKAEGNKTSLANKFKELNSKQISLKKEEYPSKTTMNLYSANQDKGEKKSLRLLIIGGVIILILFIVIAIVIPVFNLAMKQGEVNKMQSQIESMNTQMADYDAVRSEYLTYTDGYLTDEEKTLVDRVTVFKMLDQAVSGNGTINSASILGNEVKVALVCGSLEDAATIRQAIEKQPMVKEVAVTTAASSSGSGNQITASITIKLQQPASSTTTQGEGA